MFPYWNGRLVRNERVGFDLDVRIARTIGKYEGGLMYAKKNKTQLEVIREAQRELLRVQGRPNGNGLVPDSVGAEVRGLVATSDAR